MFNRTTRLRWRRKYSRGRQQVENIGDQAEDQIDRHFFRRLSKFVDISRFVFGWVFLIVLLGSITILQTRSLGSYYLQPTPVAGGIYTEGFVGAFTNANPLFATSQVDKSVAKLVFAGLLKPDSNNDLVGDLAQSWTVNAAADEYVVTLKEGLRWHDGKPLTSEDVVFTFDMAGLPDTKSPLQHAWREVTVTAVDTRVVKFKLETALAAFPHSLTTGIIPKHLLGTLQPEQLRSASFNILQPIGSGPFKWQTIETVGTDREKIEQHIGLQANKDYIGGAPKIDRFHLNTYSDDEQLVNAFANQKISAMVGVDQLPDELANDRSVIIHETPMIAANMAFFKMDSDILKDLNLRRALVQAVDIPKLVEGIGFPTVRVDQPVLREHRVYQNDYKQYGYDTTSAKKLLKNSGWTVSPGSKYRMKGTTTLHINLYAQNTSDFRYVTTELQKAWEGIGVKVAVLLQSPEDLQATVSNRTYDVLLNGITIGPDPDVFVYWHSSQADPNAASRLNFSHYKSSAADAALEAARTRIDPKLRPIKIKPFLEAWKKDVPGFGLYQPRFLYITRGEVYNYQPVRITEYTDRYAEVSNWMIRLDDRLKQ